MANSSASKIRIGILGASGYTGGELLRLLACHDGMEVAVLTAEPPPEFLLLGCGTAMAPVDDGLRRAFASRGIVLEVMDTGAAARTYNMLLNENRRFAAALIAVS